MFVYTPRLRGLASCVKNKDRISLRISSEPVYSSWQQPRTLANSMDTLTDYNLPHSHIRNLCLSHLPNCSFSSDTADFSDRKGGDFQCFDEN